MSFVPSLLITLQTIPASDPEEWFGKVDGFSLRAGVAAKAHERKKLERLSEGGPAAISPARQ